MKNVFAQRPTSRFALLLVFIVFLQACKKNNDDPTKGFIPKIQNIVPTKIIDDLKARGMTINEGQVPPKLNGAFLIAPFVLVSPYGTDDPWQKGKVIDDYKYQFHDQTDAGDIQFDFANTAEVGKGQGAFIAGNGSTFTIFAETSSVSSSVFNKTLAVISGEISSAGIKNFQYALVMKEKTGDSNDYVLIGIGKGRIWKDSDGLSKPTAGFRSGVSNDLTSAATMGSSN